MKFTIEIDATPKDVRDSLGLPDIQAVQERIIEKIEGRVMDCVDTYDPTKLLTMFVPEGARLFDGLQKTLFDGVRAAGKSRRKKD
ncbi:MAG: hypothetical protein KAG92_03615 [Deltaproteobacteria bacterium]|nr:hypothetical protein [Deltaproteobacteria bacterium]